MTKRKKTIEKANDEYVMLMVNDKGNTPGITLKDHLRCLLSAICSRFWDLESRVCGVAVGVVVVVGAGGGGGPAPPWTPK